LASGAAAGIAAVFNSPIAGVIFAIEVLLTDITIPVLIPLLIATASSTIVSSLLYKGHLFYLITTQWYYHAIPFYIILGIICGFLSVYMTRVTLSLEGYFESKSSIWLKAIMGGLTLGILIFLFPPLFGEGYTSVTNLLNGDFVSLFDNSLFDNFKKNPWILMIMTMVIIFLKVVATSLTLGSGGNGGIFAPSLFTGALTGFLLAFFINTTGITNLHVSNFIVVGMAGIMSGVVHAPLTALFLIAEITGGYVLFVPLMIVAALSFFISRYFEPYTIYTKNLVNKGYLSTDNRDKNILTQLNMDDLIETDFIPLVVTAKFGSIVEAFNISARNIFPVTDENGLYIGIIRLEKIKEFLFRNELHGVLTVEQFTERTSIVVDVGEGMESVMSKFERSGQWNFPVTKEGRYVGFISRSSVLSYYRRILKKSASLF
jgi:CIC family chloride channel protein